MPHPLSLCNSNGSNKQALDNKKSPSLSKYCLKNAWCITLYTWKIDQRSKPRSVSESTLLCSFNAPLTCLNWVRIDRKNPSWRTTKFLFQIFGKDYTSVSPIWFSMVKIPHYNILLAESLSVSFFENDKHFSFVPFDIASTVQSWPKPKVHTLYFV